MKIFGLEIKRSNNHADASVVIQPNDNMRTQPSLPLKKSYPRAELGDSGTRGTKGVITEEYNPQLQGIQGVRIFDEMRKSDGTVRAAMLVTTLPIRRAKWFVNPATDDEKDIEIANFVEHALFDWMRDSWDDIVRQALLMIPFGVMVFEKVYDAYEFNGKTYVTIKKLAPRLPKSIQQWELTDGTFGIQQVMQEGGLAQIPGSKLLVFVNEREGDNWWGTSMLRAAYKHWYYKNNFYKIDAVAFERQGLGVPVITMPTGYTESDEQKAITAASNLRANEAAYLVLPPEYKAEFMNMGAGTTRDPQNSINHHNKEILQSVLAQFLELGQTSSGGGSRALSEDHTDLFLNSLEAVANNLISEFNQDLIVELVDMNFDDVEVYPKLDYSGITRVDASGLATTYKTLKDAGAITPIPEDEQYLRAAMGLSQRTQEDVLEEEKPTTQEQIDHINIPVTPKEEDIDDATEDIVEEPKTTEEKEVVTKKTDEIEAHDHSHHKHARIFDDGTGFMTWRKQTFAEQKVSLANIEDKMNTLQIEFTTEATELLDQAKTDFIAKLQKALDNNETSSISDLEIKFVKDYKALIKDFMKNAYEYGKKNASKEMGVNTPPNNAATLASIDLVADTIAWKAAIDIETKAKTSTANALKKLSEIKIAKEKFASIIQVVGTIDYLLDGAIEKIISGAAGLIINQAINQGRNDVFQKNATKIHALQRSEILDEDTCAFCLSMDGRIVALDDDWASEDVFHTNCRGLWVEILNDEAELPEIDGVPENLADYYGGEPNSLLQPRKPIIRPDSPAKEEVERRANEKKQE